MARSILIVLVAALALPLSAQRVDSVFVALAKRTNRLGKVPKYVITNETVAASSGRISWGMEREETSQADSNATSSGPVPMSDWAYAEAQRERSRVRGERHAQDADRTLASGRDVGERRTEERRRDQRRDLDI